MTARSEVERLLAELQDAHFKLEIEPTTTVEYVESLKLLDDIHERVSLHLLFPLGAQVLPHAKNSEYENVHSLHWVYHVPISVVVFQEPRPLLGCSDSKINPLLHVSNT